MFDHAGHFTHLLEPRSGRRPHRSRSVSVLAPDATLADALSTGFSLMPESAIAHALPGLPRVKVRLLRQDGAAVAMGAGPAGRPRAITNVMPSRPDG